MTKKETFILIPLAIIDILLIYTWTIILFTDIIADWRHYVALGLFISLIILYFKNFKATVLATGIYLILGTCNLLTLTPSVKTSSYGLSIGPFELWTPTFQFLSLGILLLYLVLNFDTLVDIRLDYLEEKQARKSK